VVREKEVFFLLYPLPKSRIIKMKIKTKNKQIENRKIKSKRKKIKSSSMSSTLITTDRIWITPKKVQVKK